MCIFNFLTVNIYPNLFIFKIFQSEDLSLLRREIEHGLKDLKSMLQLKNECVNKDLIFKKNRYDYFILGINNKKLYIMQNIDKKNPIYDFYLCSFFIFISVSGKTMKKKITFVVVHFLPWLTVKPNPPY